MISFLLLCLFNWHLCVGVLTFVSWLCLLINLPMFQYLPICPSIHVKKHQFKPIHLFLVGDLRAYSSFALSISDSGGHSQWRITYLPPLPFVEVDSQKNLSVFCLILIFLSITCTLELYLQKFHLLLKLDCLCNCDS